MSKLPNQEEALYQKYLDGRHWEGHPTEYAERFVAFLKEQKQNGIVVDLGCGNGRDAAVFQKHGFDVVGIDHSENEIKNARDQKPTLKFEIQNVENLQFPDGSLAACFMINVIHYVDQEKAIQEILRTLKPQGYLFIHFNLFIVDQATGRIDYSHPTTEIARLLNQFRTIYSRVFNRFDATPTPHTHTIAELILQKNKS